MRLLAEIAIIAIGLFIIFTLSNDKSQVENNNSRLKDSIIVLEDQLSVKEKANDSIKSREEKLEKEIDSIKEKPKQVRSRYEDSLEKMKNQPLADLAGDTSKIIEKEDTNYVLVEENNYRSMRENKVKLKKLETICGIYEQEIEKQTDLLKLKNMRIENYKNQISVYRNKSAQQEKIIKNQQEKISGQKQEIDRQKWHKRILIGGGTAIILLFAL